MRRVKFPKRIKSGSCIVTIYKTPARGYDLFTVVHYDEKGARCRSTFADYPLAYASARDLSASLASGQADCHILAGEELIVYRRALQALQPTGVSLDMAAMQFAKPAQQSNGSTQAAGSAAALPHQNAIKPVTAATVLAELLEIKAQKGRSELYLTDLRVRLTRFADAFTKPLAGITSDDIDGFLTSLNVSARSQNNFRSAIGTLFRFGQSKGYVPREHPGVNHVDKASQTAEEVAVFSPDEIEKLLRAAKDELVATVALGAFAGVRSEEIKRLTWEDIHLEEGHIEIKGAKSKTKTRRLIPIQENLKAWLLPHAVPHGPVVPVSNLALQFAKLAKKARVPWKKNALRHSYISYRTAQTNNVPMVSLEAGNSVSVISRSYLRCVTPAAARQWFGVVPSKASHPASGLSRHAQPSISEQWAKSGWQHMVKESRSLGDRFPAANVPAAPDSASRTLEPAPMDDAQIQRNQTRLGQILDRDSSNSIA
jgi:integrase